MVRGGESVGLFRADVRVGVTTHFQIVSVHGSHLARDDLPAMSRCLAGAPILVPLLPVYHSDACKVEGPYAREGRHRSSHQ